VRVSAIVLAYGDQPYLLDVVDALLASRGVEVDVVLVDNGCTDPDLERLRSRAAVQILQPGYNTGFTGGCNLGAQAASGELLAFVNSDAIVEPDALAALASVAVRPEVCIASASLRLASSPDLMNSAGNPLHVLGLSWAGALGETAQRHQAETDITSATGAAMMVRRDVWTVLRGFTEPFFAYCEDADLSLRCWQAGWSVRFVPNAVVRHHYEFSRNPSKWYLLERNRLAMLLCDYELRTLVLLLPPLLALEVALLLVASAGGWFGAKLRGYRWLWRHRRWLRRRRSELRAVRRRTDRELAHLLTPSFDSQVLPLPAGTALLNATMRTYWAVVSRFL
jgi:GT2 family glycosyltransferase